MGKVEDLIKQVAVAFVAAMGGFVLGTAIGWSSSTTHIWAENNVTELMNNSWPTSILALGAASSVIPVPFMMDFLGRKISFIIMDILCSGSWLILTFAGTNVWVFCIGRFLSGLSSGAFCILSPNYIGEISSPEIRGALGNCFQFFLVIGILVEFGLGMLDSIPTYCGISVIFPLIMAVLCIFIPESPTYLIERQAPHERIVKIFKFLRGENFDADEEITRITEAMEEAKKNAAEGVWNKMKTKSNMRAFAITMMLMFAQQLSGINCVIFYAANIFESTDKETDPRKYAILLGVVQIVATLISVLLVDYLGRKILLSVSFIIMGVCLGIIAAYFINSSWPPGFPIACMCIYLLGFSLGAGPLPWSMLGEMFAPVVKGAASSACAFTNWILAFIVTQSFNPLIVAMGDKGKGEKWVFLLYTILCGISVACILLFTIETKGKSLEEIQELLGAAHVDAAAEGGEGENEAAPPPE